MGCIQSDHPVFELSESHCLVEMIEILKSSSASPSSQMLLNRKMFFWHGVWKFCMTVQCGEKLCYCKVWQPCAEQLHKLSLGHSQSQRTEQMPDTARLCSACANQANLCGPNRTAFSLSDCTCVRFGLRFLVNFIRDLLAVICVLTWRFIRLMLVCQHWSFLPHTDTTSHDLS